MNTRRIAAVLVAVGLSLAACGGDPAPAPAAPAPVVTVTEVAPAPETETETTPETDDVTQSSGYITTTTLLEKAWSKQSNPELLCIVWGNQREKWLGKFVKVAMASGVAYDEAGPAVEDFFDGKCGV